MIRARKRFGQHFLEPVWVHKIIKAIAPQADQDFIEIGPARRLTPPSPSAPSRSPRSKSIATSPPRSKPKRSRT
jgi:hypothetical protein